MPYTHGLAGGWQLADVRYGGAPFCKETKGAKASHGSSRCPWAKTTSSTPIKKWGVPVHGDRVLCKFLVLCRTGFKSACGHNRHWGTMNVPSCRFRLPCEESDSSMDQATVESDTVTQSPDRLQFTRRTLFVAMARVAGAVGLFLRYYGWHGLLLGVLLVFGGWSYLRGDRRAVVKHLTTLIVFWLLLQFFGPYTSLRNRVVWIVGTDRLQQWAIDVLDNPPQPDEHDKRYLDVNALPEDIRILAGPIRQQNSVLMFDDDRDQHCIQFGHGGGFYHWGILVGRSGFAPRPRHRYFKIADGIWGFVGD